jgi:hypothetical protein
MFILAAGFVSLFAVIGHFAMGYRMFLKPVLQSSAANIPKKVMSALFHYMSVFMIVTTLVLINVGLGTCKLFKATDEIVLFIGILYCGFAIAQLIIAVTSGIKGGIFKMFQWILWLTIAILCFM